MAVCWADMKVGRLSNCCAERMAAARVGLKNWADDCEDGCENGCEDGCEEGWLDDCVLG